MSLAACGSESIGQRSLFRGVGGGGRRQRRPQVVGSCDATGKEQRSAEAGVAAVESGGSAGVLGGDSRGVSLTRVPQWGLGETPACGSNAQSDRASASLCARDVSDSTAAGSRLDGEDPANATLQDHATWGAIDGGVDRAQTSEIAERNAQRRLTIAEHLRAQRRSRDGRLYIGSARSCHSSDC